MGGIFGGAKKVKAPAPKPPPAVPTEVSQEVIQKAEDKRRKMLAALGRRGTILAGLGETTGTTTVLGEV